MNSSAAWQVAIYVLNRHYMWTYQGPYRRLLRFIPARDIKRSGDAATAACFYNYVDGVHIYIGLINCTNVGLFETWQAVEIINPLSSYYSLIFPVTELTYSSSS